MPLEARFKADDHNPYSPGSILLKVADTCPSRSAVPAPLLPLAIAET
jgi:hypothetical protein